MTIKGRWHLGEIRLRSGWEPLLDAGHRLDAAEPLRGEVTHAGRVLDFSLTSFNVPVATTALANAVRAVAGGDVQCIPVEIAGQTGMFVLNSARVLRCLDEAAVHALQAGTHQQRHDGDVEQDMRRDHRP